MNTQIKALPDTIPFRPTLDEMRRLVEYGKAMGWITMRPDANEWHYKLYTPPSKRSATKEPVKIERV